MNVQRNTMFSKQEAVDFVQSRWGLQRVEERLCSDRTALMDDIVISIQSHVPFQSLTLMSVPLSQRRRPSLAAIKEECMSGAGGICYCISVFVWELLNGLGFSAQLCPSTITYITVTQPDTHLIVLVNDLEKKGDLHLVDCSCAYPTFRAVSLNFEEESPVFVDSFLEYKYIRREGQYLRMHGDGDRLPEDRDKSLDFFVGKFRRLYYFSLRPSDDVSDFAATYDHIYTSPKPSQLNSRMLALGYPNKRAVMMSNNRLRLEDDSGKLETTVLEEDEIIFDTYRRFFPGLKDETVRRAIEVWHRIQELPKHENQVPGETSV